MTPQGYSRQSIAQLLALSHVGPLTISFPSLNSGSPAGCPGKVTMDKLGRDVHNVLRALASLARAKAEPTTPQPPPPQAQSPSFFNPLETSNRKLFPCQNILLSTKCVSHHDDRAATAFSQWGKIRSTQNHLDCSQQGDQSTFLKSRLIKTQDNKKGWINQGLEHPVNVNELPSENLSLYVVG